MLLTSWYCDCDTIPIKSGSSESSAEKWQYGYFAGYNVCFVYCANYVLVIPRGDLDIFHASHLRNLEGTSCKTCEEYLKDQFRKHFGEK
jgi:hypothetical protein